MTRDVLVLIAEAIAIREPLRVVAHVNMDNLFMKNDSQIVVYSTLSRIKASGQIINVITDIVTLPLI